MIKKGNIPGRLKKIEEKLGTGENNLLVTIVPYYLTTEEAQALVHEKNPNFQGLHVIVNTYGDARAGGHIEYDDVDSKIKQETEKIKKHGFTESEIEEALAVEEDAPGLGASESKSST
jgi:hypothetical protein